ncbi:MAG: AraC family transcriptional regulator, partial [Victivallaceae bacterium]|nr:AraC family transcriptional regulator [Victivallaceae bacterium]
LLWCRSGCGEITVNGQTFSISRGDLFFLPWNHSIAYRPDAEHPYLLASIHLIPSLPRKDDIYFVPFHSALPEYEEYRQRRDQILPGFPRIFRASLPEDAPLVTLMKYMIASYERQCPEPLLRDFARMTVYELTLLNSAALAEMPPKLPTVLQQIVNEIDRHLEDHDTLAWVYQSLDISTSTLYRLVRRQLNTTPGQLVIRRKLQFAAELLREHSLSVAQISSRLHFTDQFYFSRLFKKAFGMSPLAYRNAPLLTSGIPRFPQRHSHREEYVQQRFVPAWLGLREDPPDEKPDQT